MYRMRRSSSSSFAVRNSSVNMQYLMIASHLSILLAFSLYLFPNTITMHHVANNQEYPCRLVSQTNRMHHASRWLVRFLLLVPWGRGGGDGPKPWYCEYRIDVLFLVSPSMVQPWHAIWMIVRLLFVWIYHR